MNIKSLLVTCASFAGLLFGLSSSGTVLAQGMYIVGSIEHASVDINKADIDSGLRTAGVTGLSSTTDESSTGGKIQLGYMVTPNFGIEGGWVDLGKFKYDATFTGGVANATVKASGFNLAAIGVVPISKTFDLFARIGGVNAKTKGSVTASGPGGTASGNASDTSWSTNYGLGAIYKLSTNAALRFEWDRYLKVGDKNKTGEGDVDLLSVGLRWSF